MEAIPTMRSGTPIDPVGGWAVEIILSVPPALGVPGPPVMVEAAGVVAEVEVEIAEVVAEVVCPAPVVFSVELQPVKIRQNVRIIIRTMKMDLFIYVSLLRLNSLKICWRVAVIASSTCSLLLAKIM
jgi:hypothetical protein